jgi:hypothetical protein
VPTVQELARVTIVAGATGAVACELCTSESNLPTTSVVVRHARGGVVQFAACDWCVQAVRRLTAATGGYAIFGLAETGGPPPSALKAVPLPPVTRSLSPPILIMELTQEIQDAVTGTPYVVRVYGRERVDGTWEGWLEFVAVGASIVIRTDRETTQSNREDLAYWATGLGDAYLQGAFRRAHRVGTAASAGV